MSGKCQPDGLFVRLQQAMRQGAAALDWSLAQEPQPITALTTHLQHALAPLLAMDAKPPAVGHPRGLLLRLTCPLGEGAPSPLAWMHAQTSPQRMYWHDRHKTQRWAGCGETEAFVAKTPAHTQEVMAALQSRLADAPAGLRYFGGFRFSPASACASHWQAFGVTRWQLPFAMLCQEGEARQLHLHLRLTSQESFAEVASNALAQWERIRWQCPDSEARPVQLQAKDIQPNHARWCDNIRSAQVAFKSSPLDKVVLATESTFATQQPTTPQDWSAWIMALGAASHDTYLFYHQPDAAHAFLGASPERLFLREGRALSSEALAGTLPRGANSEEDNALGAELLASTKDRREQEIVTEDLLQRLARCCEDVTASATPSLKKLRHVQHLWTPLQGTAKAELGDLDLLKQLHPTPAVGGRPRGLALQSIAALEPFDRGWYAAPVGWISREGAEFAVAIRSGMMTHDAVRLYAGAGIVADSEPEKEWQELGYKLRPFLTLVGATNEQPVE